MIVTISSPYSGRPAYSLHLDIAVHDQDIANNQTRFDYTLYAYHDSSSTNNSYSNTARAFGASIQGSSIASGTHNFLMGPSGDFVGKLIVIASGTTGYFAHNPDGTLTVSLGAYHNMSPDVQGNASASGSFAVPTIPRATQPTVSPTSGNTGSTYAIDVSTVASSAFYHDFYYSLDGDSTYTSIASNIHATTTSQNWTPAHTLLPNSTSVTAIIRVDTRDSSGGTIIGSKTVNLPLTVPTSVKPTVSSVAWADGQVSAPDMPTLMGGSGRFVQKWSKLKPTATSSGASGSTVTETDITVNAQTVQSGVAFGSAIALSGSVPFSAVAIDSRLRSSDPLTGTVAVTPYSFPNLPTPTVTRTSDSAGLIPSPSGTYLAITPAASVSSLVFGAVEKNLLEWQVRIKPVGGAYTTVQAWTNATVSGNTWTTKAIFSGYSSSTGYVVEVSIRDLFGKNGYDTTDTVVVLTIQVPSEAVVIDYDAGNGIGFGKYRQAAAYDFAGAMNVDADVAAVTFHQGGIPVVDTTSITAIIAAALAVLIPPGNIELTAASAAPTGWLLCDGSTVSRSTYANLFTALNPTIGTVTMTIATPAVVTKTAHGQQTGQMVYLTTTGALPTGLVANTAYFVIRIDANTFNLATTLANALAGTKIATTGSQSGTHTLRTTYGVGNGSTTFTVPNLKGSVAIGVDTGQTEFAALGQTGGEKAHTLILSETPAHTHTIVHTTGSGATASGDAIPPHNSTPNANFATTSSQGGGGSHNNLNPYVALNYIIKI